MVVLYNGTSTTTRSYPRYVAEEMLGRTLERHEEVHHKDHDPDNNHPDNLVVLTKDEHYALHLKAKGLSYREPKSCLTCSTITTNQKYCTAKCKGIGERKCERPSKEELAEQIQAKSWLQLGRDYGVSDNAVRNWARKYGLL